MDFTPSSPRLKKSLERNRTAIRQSIDMHNIDYPKISKSSPAKSSDGDNKSILKRAGRSYSSSNINSDSINIFDTRSDIDPSIWVPPITKLKATTPSNHVSTHFFPLELTSKDYIRRVLDIVVHGIKDKVIEVPTFQRQTNYQIPRLIIDENDHDIIPYLRQIMGQSPSVQSSSEAAMIRQAYANELGIESVGKMINSATILLNKRMELFSKIAEDKGSIDDLDSLFSAAKSLLLCFQGVIDCGSGGGDEQSLGRRSTVVFSPVTVSLKRLAELKDQIVQHKHFKECRMKVLGWPQATDAFTSPSPIASQNVALEIENKIKVTLAASLPLIEPAAVAHTTLIARLLQVQTDLKINMEEAAIEKKFSVADNSNKLMMLMAATIEEDTVGYSNAAVGGNGYNRIVHVTSLRDSLSILVADCVAYEDNSINTRDFAGAQELLSLRLQIQHILHIFTTALSPVSLPLFPPPALTSQQFDCDSNRSNAPLVHITEQNILYTNYSDSTSSTIFSLIRDSKSVHLIKYICRHWLKEMSMEAFESGSDPLSDTCLRAAGFSAVELSSTGVNVSRLRVAGFSAKELLDSGAAIAELQTVGVTVVELREAGCNVSDLLGVYTLHDLVAGGYAEADLYAHGCSFAELRQVGIGLSRLMAIGCSLKELKKMGASIDKFREANCSVASLREVGYTLRECREAGYSVAEARESTAPVSALLDAGYDLKEMLQLATTHAMREFKLANAKVADLRIAGFSSASVKDAGYSLREMQEGGYTARELKDIGITVVGLKEAGYSFQQLSPEFTARELKQAGVL